MKKKENFCITAIEDVYLLRIQVTEESGVKCFFEVTISKEIDKMSHDIGAMNIFGIISKVSI